MPFPFLGDSTRIYTQYLAADGLPLAAEPGGSYDMTPVPSQWLMPVPPGDGLWGPEPGPEPEPEPPAPPVLPVLIIPPAETEEI